MSDDFSTADGDTLSVTFGPRVDVGGEIATIVAEAVAERYGIDPDRVSVEYASVDRHGVTAEVSVRE
ncbi:MAG: hypothetical protein ACLFSD_00095 [Salinivenus sp.]